MAALLAVALWPRACPECSKRTKRGQYELHPPTPMFSLHLSFHAHSSIISFTGVLGLFFLLSF